MRAIYTIATGAAVALTASTARSVLCVLCPSQFGIDLLGIELGFDASAAAAGVLVEICQSTAATNSTPGTNNSTATVTQVAGRTVTPGFTGFYASAATFEPTVLTVVQKLTIPPNGGGLIYDWPRDASPDMSPSGGLVLRCTSGSSVNVNATMTFARC